jgi:prepilin-type N-terminal cleavage/methylation domain-containing protein
MKNRKNIGFTLIELLMVIAIIGILAGILIPAVGAVRKQANIAASKAQISNYITAIQMFKGEYGYYPFVTDAADKVVDLSSSSQLFIQTLSGRNTDGTQISASEAATVGNRRRIAFHSFSETEYLIDDDDEVDTSQLADRFNNVTIKLMIDASGDGFVLPAPTGDAPSAPSGKIKTDVTAWVESTEDYPGYSLWN